MLTFGHTTAGIIWQSDQLIWLNDTVDRYLAPREAWGIPERMETEAGNYVEILKEDSETNKCRNATPIMVRACRIDQ